MLPAQRKKVDLGTMTEEEKKLFRLYGKLPTHKNVLTKVQKDRKYFDSGDYALSKAGVAPQSNVGTAIPSPENIPHASPPTALNTATSPSSTPGAHGSSPIRDSPLVPTGSSPLTIDLSGSSNEGQSVSIDPSTSPTSSYPIHTNELHSSPLNPHTSSSSSSEDTPTSAATSDPVAVPAAENAVHKPRTVDFTTVVPSMHKPHPLSQAAALPNSSTPASGAEADTEMA